MVRIYKFVWIYQFPRLEMLIIKLKGSKYQNITSSLGCWVRAVVSQICWLYMGYFALA